MAHWTLSLVYLIAIITMDKQVRHPKVADKCVRLQTQPDVTSQVLLVLPFALPWNDSMGIGWKSLWRIQPDSDRIWKQKKPNQPTINHSLLIMAGELRLWKKNLPALQTKSIFSIEFLLFLGFHHPFTREVGWFQLYKIGMLLMLNKIRVSITNETDRKD